MNKIKLALAVAYDIAKADLQRAEDSVERNEGTQFEAAFQLRLDAARDNMLSIKAGLAEAETLTTKPPSSPQREGREIL